MFENTVRQNNIWKKKTAFFKISYLFVEGLTERNKRETGKLLTLSFLRLQHNCIINVNAPAMSNY